MRYGSCRDVEIQGEIKNSIQFFAGVFHFEAGENVAISDCGPDPVKSAMNNYFKSGSFPFSSGFSDVKPGN